MPFTESLAKLEPKDFVTKILLVNDIEITTVCIGQDWRFGHKGKGDTELLKLLGKDYGFDVFTVSKVKLGKQPLSSTRLRKALVSGDLDCAREILGRHFSILGNVTLGKGIATSDLQCPTANVVTENDIFPPNGVYAASVKLFSSQGAVDRKPGVLYLGNSPTLVTHPPQKPILEIHIFDFNKNIYGDLIEVEFIKFLREDKKFDTVEKLRKQVQQDLISAKESLGQKI